MRKYGQKNSVRNDESTSEDIFNRKKERNLMNSCRHPGSNIVKTVFKKGTYKNELL